MIKTIAKIGFWTVIGLGTGMLGLGVLAALGGDSEFPLEEK